jgi:DNA-binding beta-propeller fold protein YncE
VAITPNGKTLYVVNEGSGTKPGRPLRPITVGRVPTSIVITPNGTTAYVSNLLAGTTLAAARQR